MWRFLSLFFIPMVAFANPARVLELRQEVEKLAEEVETVRKEQQSLVDVYIQRRQEVQALILREKFRGDQLLAQKNRLGAALKERNLSTSATVKAPEWFAPLMLQIENELEQGLPLGEKSSELAKIRATLSSGKTTVESALVQTWFVLDAALKYRTSTEFILAPVTLANTTSPAEVARLGDLLAYVRTAEGKYGLLSRTKASDKWTFTQFENKTEQDQVEKLLSQFKQNQKTGLYQLPGMQTLLTNMRQGSSL